MYSQSHLIPGARVPNTSNAPADNPNFKPVLVAVCIIGLILFAIVQSCSSSGDDGSPGNAAGRVSAASTSAQSPSPETLSQAPSQIAPEDLVPGRDYDPDLVFILNLNNGGVPYASEGTAIEAAGQICMAIGGGAQAQTVQATAVNAGGYSIEDAGYFLGAAVNAYCPQYEYLLN